jgi:hypothetical protein
MTPRRCRAAVPVIRVTDDRPLHAQLVLVAQFEGSSLTDMIRQAIEQLIERKRGEGDLEGRAAEALAEIEREATARRDAIQALFGTAGNTPAVPQEPKQRGRRGGGSTS